MPQPRRRPALTGVLVAAAVIGTCVLSLSASAATAPPAVAVLPLLSALTSGPVCDGRDEEPDYADIDCDDDGVSAYFGADSSTLAAALVLEASPLTSNKGPAPVQSTTYVVQLGVGGVHRASFGVDGKGTNDTDVLYAGCAGASTPAFTVTATDALASGWLVVVPDGSRTRMTFFVPRSALAGCGITATTPLSPYVGTSQAGPLENVNKDFFLGDEVSFTATNVAPVAADDTLTLPLGAGATAVDVVANDGDADGDLPLRVVSVGPALVGAVSLDPLTGVVTYAPAGSSGTDSFTYVVQDARGARSAPATVTVLRSELPSAAPSPSDATDPSPSATALASASAQPSAEPSAQPSATVEPSPSVVPSPSSSTEALPAASSEPSPSVQPSASPVSAPSPASTGVEVSPSEVTSPSPSPSATPAVPGSADPVPADPVPADPVPAQGGGVDALDGAEVPVVTGSPISGTTESSGTTQPPGTTEPSGAVGEPVTDATSTAARPSALPFTGLSADALLALGAGLSVLGLLSALAGRRRRTA